MGKVCRGSPVPCCHTFPVKATGISKFNKILFKDSCKSKSGLHCWKKASSFPLSCFIGLEETPLIPNESAGNMNTHSCVCVLFSLPTLMLLSYPPQQSRRNTLPAAHLSFSQSSPDRLERSHPVKVLFPPDIFPVLWGHISAS